MKVRSWVKWQRCSAAGYDKHQWQYFCETVKTLKEFEELVEEFFNEKDQEWYWSDKHRGHKWEYFNRAPELVIQGHINGAKFRIIEEELLIEEMERYL